MYNQKSFKSLPANPSSSLRLDLSSSTDKPFLTPSLHRSTQNPFLNSFTHHSYVKTRAVGVVVYFPYIPNFRLSSFLSADSTFYNKNTRVWSLPTHIPGPRPRLPFSPVFLRFNRPISLGICTYKKQRGWGPALPLAGQNTSSSLHAFPRLSYTFLMTVTRGPRT
jgi:hypothetical protein